MSLFSWWSRVWAEGMPAAPLLQRPLKPKQRRKARRHLDKRARLFTAQDGRCILCEQPFQGRPTLEHLVPRGQGGTHHLINLALSCWACNNKRGTRTLTPEQVRRVQQLHSTLQIHPLGAPPPCSYCACDALQQQTKT